jgi:O-methyltransferase/methyltransferase family protein
MSEDVGMGAGNSSLPATLLQMMTGYWVSQALHVAAKLGIADLLTDGPVDCEDLAAATDTHAPSLQRVLRALASVGVFTEVSPGSFALTPLAELLRTETPGSMRALAIMYAEEQYRAWGELLHSVRTGEMAFDHQFGMGYFEYLAQHPEADRVFNAAMTGWTHQLVGAVVDTYDFSSFRTVVDVGGGYGALLAAILRNNPDTRGILFEQPHVIASAAEQLMATGVADRCTLVGGDFFAAVPAGGDAYVLSQILHDWDDERCVAILGQCRRVMPDHGTLLVVELVLPPGDEPFLGKWLDLHMLVLLGGRERTAAEYETLFLAAGFELARVVPTSPGPSVVEAVPA